MELSDFPSLTEAMAESRLVHGVLSAFALSLKQKDAWQRACTDVSAHKPEFHQHPLVPSIERGVQAAYQLRTSSAAIGHFVDVVVPLALCDIGKARAFVAGEPNYRLSEILSAQTVCSTIAGEGHDPDMLLLILAHKLSYQAKPETIIAWSHKPRRKTAARQLRVNLNLLRPSRDTDLQWLMRLLAVFACRAVARGWTEAQKVERPKEAELVQTICDQQGLSSFGQLLCQEFILAQ